MTYNFGTQSENTDMHSQKIGTRARILLVQCLIYWISDIIIIPILFLILIFFQEFFSIFSYSYLGTFVFVFWIILAFLSLPITIYMTIIFIRTPKVFITFNGNNLIITPKKGKEIIINPLEINYIGENKSYWRYGMVSSAGTITIQAKNELIKIHYVKDGTLVKHTLEKIRYSAYIMQQNQYHQQQSTNF